ncbi:hypothetical protein [Legionella sp. km772]|uniref:hypothetical protein n=1 Tax=Legionella sp. km772 TaxID=2498111 RepID=UPI000F8F7B3D|nr:hypothetical protein [Legionella sp. km772]RUR12254.1 hypothetical protein ELY15_05730 [Legionella sp. km772]
MAGSTQKILEIMRAGKNVRAQNHSSLVEAADLDAPQLKPSPNMGKKLEEILNASLTNQHTPMD